MATQNLNSASKAARASALSQLDSLGSAKSDFDTADVFSASENDVAAFIERVKENINATDMIVTGGIADIRIETSDTGIKLLGNPWLLYQDRGAQGAEDSSLAPDSPHKYTDKMPPSSVFVEYITRKNINLRNNENFKGKPHNAKESPHADLAGDDKAIQSAAFAMAKTVYKKGFKPQPIFAKEIPKLVEDLKETLGSFFSNQIKSGIRDREGNDIYNTGK